MRCQEKFSLGEKNAGIAGISASHRGRFITYQRPLDLFRSR